MNVLKITLYLNPSKNDFLETFSFIYVELHACLLTKCHIFAYLADSLHTD